MLIRHYRAPAAGIGAPKKRAECPPTFGPGFPDVRVTSPVPFQSTPLTSATPGAWDKTQEACQRRRWQASGWVARTSPKLLGAANYDAHQIACHTGVVGKLTGSAWESKAPTPGEVRNRGDPGIPAGSRHGHDPSNVRKRRNRSVAALACVRGSASASTHGVGLRPSSRSRSPPRGCAGCMRGSPFRS